MASGYEIPWFIILRIYFNVFKFISLLNDFKF